MGKLRRYTPSDSMSELIENDPRIMLVISRFEIGFGFGDHSVRKACEDHGVDPETFLSVIVATFEQQADLSGDVARISPEGLLEYLANTHRYYLGYRLPEIRRDLIDLWDGSENEAARTLLKYFDDVIEMVTKHTGQEERVIFPYVRSLAVRSRRVGEGVKHPAEVAESRAPINVHNMHVKHHPIRLQLSELRRLVIKYYAARDNIRMNGLLFKIFSCEFDLISHGQVEDTLLFPLIAHLEGGKGGRDDRDGKGGFGGGCGGGKSSSATGRPRLGDRSSRRNEPLTQREKDIVVCIANGLTNKQIADRLHLSHLTIGTHRRNIATKLDIHTISGLTVYAISNNLIRFNDTGYAPRTNE